jgi:hypothetical protein
MKRVIKSRLFLCVKVNLADIHNKGMCAKQVHFLWEKEIFPCTYFFQG